MKLVVSTVTACAGENNKALAKAVAQANPLRPSRVSSKFSTDAPPSECHGTNGSVQPQRLIAISGRAIRAA